MIRTVTALLICAAAALAQDGDRVNVPLSDPSRPVRIHASLLTGSIVVHGANTNQVTVESHGGRHGENHEPPPNAAGMHRLDAGGGFDITEQDNVVDIKTTSWTHGGDLVITVPRRSSLQLKTLSGGGIEADDVDGEIDVNALNGPITLRNVSGSVLAHSLNGAVTVTMNQVDPTKPMAFSTLNGAIDVTLPDNVRANVRMKTDNGDIYTDFDVKLSTSPSVDTDTDHGNRHYHVRIDHSVRGTINGGGPEYQFTSLNGAIYVRKRK